jgi:hypothetical protein
MRVAAPVKDKDEQVLKQKDELSSQQHAQKSS